MMKTLYACLVATLMLFGSFRAMGQEGELPLKTGEALRISVLGVPQADIVSFSSTPFTISNGGTVNLPHIGEIRASGLTPSALAKSIESAYKSAQIYTRPSINISKDQSSPTTVTQNTVTVSGNVRQTGVVTWRPSLRLIDAISERGGFDDFANKARVKLIRDSRETIYDMRKIAPTNNVLLKPGDVVHVGSGGGIFNRGGDN